VCPGSHDYSIPPDFSLDFSFLSETAPPGLIKLGPSCPGSPESSRLIIGSGLMDWRGRKSTINRHGSLTISYILTKIDINLRNK